MVTIMRNDVKKVRQVLKDYSKIKHDIANVNFLPSPQLNTISSHSNSNHAENKFVHHADLSYQLHQVDTAIDSIKDSKYRFIIRKYIINKRYNRQQLCQRYGIGLRTFNNMKNRALLEFAKNYGLDSVVTDMTKPQVYE